MARVRREAAASMIQEAARQALERKAIAWEEDGQQFESPTPPDDWQFTPLDWQIRRWLYLGHPNPYGNPST